MQRWASKFKTIRYKWPYSLYWLAFRMPAFRSYCLNKAGVENIVPFKWYNWHNGASCYTAVINGQPIFIKSDGIHRLLRHESRMTHLFFSQQPKHCPELVFSHFGSAFSFIGLKLIAGRNLKELLQKKITLNWDRFFTQLLTILDSLYVSKMIHRDITPSNLMITPEIGEKTFTLSLIDFTFSLIPGENNIDSVLEKSSTKNLGQHLNPSPYLWDDAYACHQILNHIQSCTGLSFPDWSKEFETRISRLSHVFGQPLSENGYQLNWPPKYSQ